MLCARTHCVMSTSTCLSKQAELDGKRRNKLNFMALPTGDAHLGLKPGVSHLCYRCEQGERAKKGEFMDEDVEGLKKNYSLGNLEHDNRPEGLKEDGSGVVGRKETNRAGVFYAYPKPDLEIDRPAPTPTPGHHVPPRTLVVEISGQRIELCAECARKYLRI